MRVCKDCFVYRYNLLAVRLCLSGIFNLNGCRTPDRKAVPSILALDESRMNDFGVQPLIANSLCDHYVGEWILITRKVVFRCSKNGEELCLEFGVA